MATDQRLLNYQADMIEAALYGHHISARVRGGKVLPRLTQFNLALPLGVKPEKVKALALDIASRLGVYTATVRLDGDGQVIVEVPRPDWSPVSLYAISKRIPKIPEVSAVLGLSNAGRPLVIPLASPDVAHILVAGTTGSGKSELARTIALSLAMFSRESDVQLVIVDPKGRSFGDFNALPHLLCPVVSDTAESAWVLNALVEEMLRRDDEKVSRPHIVLVVDEMADLIDAGGGDVLQSITRLTQRGRQAGIHVVGCTQKPMATSIGSLVKGNFPVRLVGSVASPEDAKVAAGIGGTQAERLAGRGDFLVICKGHAVRFQAAYIGNTAVSKALINRVAYGWHGTGPMRVDRAWILKAPDPLAQVPEVPDRWTGWKPRVVVDNRDRLEGDVALILGNREFLAHWWDEGRRAFRYGVMTAMGELLGKQNAGAGHKYLGRVAAEVGTRLDSTSTSTSTTVEAGAYGAME